MGGAEFSPLAAFHQSLREEALSLAVENSPEPWGNRAYIHAGGVLAVGWDREEHILIISNDGYSLNTPSGKRLIRNRDSGLLNSALSETGLQWTDPDSAEVIQVFGLYGGGGIATTKDGWSIAMIMPAWPEYMIILWDPSAAKPGAAGRGYFFGAHRIDIRPLAGEARGCGFSPSGRHFLVAASDGALVWSRS